MSGNCKKCHYPKNSEQHALCKERNRLADKRRREFDQANGNCTMCRNSFSSKEHLSCKEIKNKGLRKRRALAKDRGLCYRCGCSPDSEANKLSYKVRAKAIETGMCREHRQRKAVIGQACLDCWYCQIASTRLGTRRRGPEIKRLLEEQNFTCIYTDECLIPGVNASLDHIIPTSKGGNDNESNIQWVSQKINNMKTEFDSRRIHY